MPHWLKIKRSTSHSLPVHRLKTDISQEQPSLVYLATWCEGHINSPTLSSCHNLSSREPISSMGHNGFIRLLSYNILQCKRGAQVTTTNQ